ncbi:ammonium transporter Rh type A-like [Daphnia pulicaria]|uniref:ammonium transporter Rh type A-like n=1 Tax=Daphnia pulicaria TaxID=35523 RepID=UPI001EEAD504|nr:ammonium transporter Rh type A-like [Daphnia pulicaria]
MMNTCKKILKNEKLLVCAILVQLLLGCAFTLLVEYGNESNGAFLGNSLHGVFVQVSGPKSGKNSLPNSYYMFQDVHVMMFIGFGYLLILMKRSDHKSLISYFLVTAISLQWGTLCYGFFRTINGKIHLNINTLLNADFACAAVLISCAAVAELTTPLQIFLMSLLEIILYSTNNWIGSLVFQASDVGSSMFVHVFGAYFGLAVSFVLYRGTAYCAERQSSKDEASSDSIGETLSTAVGTMFLWLLWPSFTGCLAKGDAEQFRAIINTYYSLSASCVTAFAVSSLVFNCFVCAEDNRRRSFNMANILLAYSSRMKFG